MMDFSHPNFLNPNLKGYFILFLVFEVLGLGMLVMLGYEGSFLYVNGLRNPVFDFAMPHFTHLGEAVILISFFGFWAISRDKALVFTTILAALTLMVVVFGLKQTIFKDWSRPLELFQVGDFHFNSLREVYNFSFPSGHSAAAACVGLFIAYFLGSKHPFWAWVCGLLAILVAYSRLYIGVHLLGDIMAGSLLGIAIAWLFLRYVYPFLVHQVSRISESSHSKWNLGFRILLGLSFILGTVRLLNVYYLT